MATPIYQHKLSAAEWRLHWWMIAKMDERGEIHGGWRTRAEADLKIARQHIYRCVNKLVRKGLIVCNSRERYARVVVDAIVG